jgi:arsenate reductase (thioredoxin)
MTAHWGVSDPARVDGNQAEIAVAFDEAYRMLRRRIELFLALPLASIGRVALQGKLRDIGALSDAGASIAAH